MISRLLPAHSHKSRIIAGSIGGIRSAAGGLPGSKGAAERKKEQQIVPTFDQDQDADA